jgi:hypothetical protein
MSDSRRTYSPQDFLGKLQRDELELSTPMIGVAGNHEQDTDRILFGDNCTNWIPIPISMLESVEHLQTVDCSDHARHPVVAIRLKKPQSEEALVFAHLVMSSERRRRGGPRVLPAFTGNGFGGGSLGGGGIGSEGVRGAGGHGSGQVWYAIVCPEEGGIIETHLTRYLANQYSEIHNARTLHSSGVAEIPFA